MLLYFTEKKEIDIRRLLDIYSESIAENAAEFYPDEELSFAVGKEERKFVGFLNEFFGKKGNKYFVLEEEGEWVSALRLSTIGGWSYYLEAFETRPDSRRRGSAKRLICAVFEKLGQYGPFVIADCVSKTKAPSVRTHISCGFRIVSENGINRLSGTVNDRAYGMEYVHAV